MSQKGLKHLCTGVVEGVVKEKICDHRLFLLVILNLNFTCIIY